MLIVRTPFRVSLFGGGTDFPEWFNKHGGICVGMAVNKYSYLWIKHLPSFFEYNIKLFYSRIEEVLSIDEIQHGGIREVLRFFKQNHVDFNEKYEIHHASDLPAKTGIGSSSSFLVGLINGIARNIGAPKSPKELSDIANYIERVVLGEPGGLQDPIWGAYGGINTIRFNQEGFSVTPIQICDDDTDYITSSMVLLYTKTTRTASEVTKAYAGTLLDKEKQQFALMQIAEDGARCIRNLDIKKLGTLLHANWLAKKEVSDKISNPFIDQAYENGLKNGAYGGKLIGAGGGGCLLFIVPPENKKSFVEKMGNNFIHIPIDIDFSGSTIIT